MFLRHFNLTHNKRVTAKINVGLICFKAELSSKQIFLGGLIENKLAPITQTVTAKTGVAVVCKTGGTLYSCRDYSCNRCGCHLHNIDDVHYSNMPEHICIKNKNELSTKP